MEQVLSDSTGTVPTGGRAFYSPPQQIISGRKRRRRKRQSDGDDDEEEDNDLLAAMDHTNLTGLNALPPSVNITIFEQWEAWMDAGAEM